MRSTPNRKDRGAAPGASVVLVGGGNIGSHLGPHVARMREVKAVTIIDRDAYDETNVTSQAIRRRDVGKQKAHVQARRLREIRPDLTVRPIVASIEEVPLGFLKADVILACLDSREARRVVNQAAFRQGVPWIDAGVEPRGYLVRVNVYVPGSDAPCLECAWGPEDYAALEQRYPCQGTKGAPRPTDAPSSLGALAAALQAIELKRLLGGIQGDFLAGRQMLLDGLYHKHHVTSFRRNPHCLLSHAAWDIETIDRSPREVSVKEIVDHARRRFGGAGGAGPAAIRVDGRPFVQHLTCPACGREHAVARLLGRLPDSRRSCRKCGAALEPSAFDLEDEIVIESCPPRWLRRPLARLGIVARDVVTVRCQDADLHYQIGGNGK